MNVKIAAELLHPGDHPWDANPQAERLPVPVPEVSSVLCPSSLITKRSLLPTHLKLTETHVAEAWRYTLVNAS